MTIPIWPPELPQWMSASDFNTSPADARTKTPMEAGPSKYRRRVSAAVQPISGTMRFTMEQLARLDQFWIEDTKGGTLPFVFPGQVFNGTVLLTDTGDHLTTEAGEDLLCASYWLVQFANAYQVNSRRRSTIFTVGLTLNVLP